MNFASKMLCWSAFCHRDKTADTYNLKEERFIFGYTVSEVLVHGPLAPKQKYYGRGVVGRKGAHFMAVGKQNIGEKPEK